MNESDLLHLTLYYALLDIRSKGGECSDKVVFHLANLFHNIVLEMRDAANGKREYSEVVASLKRRAASAGCEEWLDAVLATIQTRSEDCATENEE